MSTARKSSMKENLAHAALLLGAIFSLAPFVTMLVLSMLGNATGGTTMTLGNYAEALTATALPRVLFNGVIVCAATLLLQILTAAPLAFALAKFDFLGRDTLFTLIVIALLIPNEIIALPLFLAFARLHLLDTYAGLIIPFAFSPFAVFLLRQHFKTVPDEIVAAARLDGLGDAAILWRIMVPMAAPAIGAFAILSIVARWNSLYWPLIAVQDPALMPPSVGILYFSNEEAGGGAGPLMAAATLTVAPLVVAFLMAQRSFIAGLTVRAVR